MSGFVLAWQNVTLVMCFPPSWNYISAVAFRQVLGWASTPGASAILHMSLTYGHPQLCNINFLKHHPEYLTCKQLPAYQSTENPEQNMAPHRYKCARRADNKDSALLDNKPTPLVLICKQFHTISGSFL